MSLIFKKNLIVNIFTIFKTYIIAFLCLFFLIGCATPIKQKTGTYKSKENIDETIFKIEKMARKCWAKQGYFGGIHVEKIRISENNYEILAFYISPGAPPSSPFVEITIKDVGKEIQIEVFDVVKNEKNQKLYGNDVQHWLDGADQCFLK